MNNCRSSGGAAACHSRSRHRGLLLLLCLRPMHAAAATLVVSALGHRRRRGHLPSGLNFLSQLCCLNCRCCVPQCADTDDTRGAARCPLGRRGAAVARVLLLAGASSSTLATTNLLILLLLALFNAAMKSSKSMRGGLFLLRCCLSVRRKAVFKHGHQLNIIKHACRDVACIRTARVTRPRSSALPDAAVAAVCARQRRSLLHPRSLHGPRV